MRRQFDDLQLGTLEMFCLAAEHGSFTAAASAAGVTPAAVSRMVARLEARLGVRMFVRTTRKIALTESGQAYYEQCRSALSQLVEAEHEVSGQQTVPSGTLRISLSTPYGHYRVLPLLPEFQGRYPDISVEVHLSNRNIDFVAEGYDLAIRGREPAESNLIVRRLEDADLVVVATPAYLAKAGTPQSLEDLRQHDCIQFVLPSNGKRIPWYFLKNGVELELMTEGGSCCTEDVLGCVTLARHGTGLLQTMRFIVEDDLHAGRLVEVLKTFAGRSRPFSVLYPYRRHVPLRVRKFLEFLFESLGKHQR